MRLWTIHPKYLDTKGLLAVWREALLAQKVLGNKTKGYRNHPQLRRFKGSTDAVGAIAGYLRGIHSEAVDRGYLFSEDKINPIEFSGRIACTRGQLLFEWRHFREKVKLRDVKGFKEIEIIKEPEAHPIFLIVEGEKEDWEITRRL